MAEALVVGALVTSAIDVLINKMASPEVLNFFKRKKLNNGQLKMLEATMGSVIKVLNDAEMKQITDPTVKTWLENLRDAVYEADDFLDGIAYEALRLELEAQPQTCIDQVRNFLSSLNPCRKGMEEEQAQLEKILQCLKDLKEQKNTLCLIEGIGETWSSPNRTTSLLDDSGVYGRDKDKEDIVKLLLSDDPKGKNLGVIPIVGMGGVGKTTLAQLVYNEVKERFDLKAWVYVSQEFDVFKIIKDILKNIGSMNCDTMTEDQLHCGLEEKLKGKKVLLVLDDVWSDNQREWEFLLTAFKSVSQGSKIIVTTRNESVASIRSTVPIHHLQELSEDDCWFLFAKHAFDGESFSGHRQLEKLGREIAKKCRGLPLATKTLGGLLRSNRDAEKWKKILRSNMWELPDGEILPALRLSYHYLSSNLKQCFAYCALFPKDYEFTKEDVVLLWIAEGFLAQPDGQEFEVGKEHSHGNEYFDELVSRSFFQRSNVDPSCFIMHDLINDLAKFVSGKFCFRFEDDGSREPTEKARHLSCTRANYNAFEEVKGFDMAPFLRSFLLRGGPRFSRNNISLESLRSLERLRVLSLFQVCVINSKLPESIGKLKHLRYLDLRGMKMETLPESVCSLYNLQILILYGISNFVALPTKMMKLINLHHLDIRGTNLQSMPPEMGKLTKLQKLTDFFVGNQSGSSIAELGKLQHLREELCIRNLRNVVSNEDAVKADLKSKEHIQKLALLWDRYDQDSWQDVLQQLDGCTCTCTDISQHHLKVLEQLQPCTELKSLSIYWYGGTAFPNWVGGSSLSNMVSLKLDQCRWCISLPPLGQLASLKDLSITQFDAVKTVGFEFCGSVPSTEKPFGSLQILRFERLPKWEEWVCDVSGAFPVLEELYIKDCPNLTKALPNDLPCLRKLEIQKCDQLVLSLPRAPTIREMRLRDQSHYMELTELHSGLRRLEVNRFQPQHPALKVIEQMGVVSATLEYITTTNCDLESLCGNEGSLGDFTSLRELSVYRCPNSASFPRISAPNLIKLHLIGCENLKWLPERMHSLLPSLKELLIIGCPEIERIPEEGFPSELVSLDITDSIKLSANFGKQWDLHSLLFLKNFTIDLDSFPEKTLLPSTLTSLCIRKIQNVECLDYERLQHITSLTELFISQWPHLQSIPEEGLPSTLTSLHLSWLENLQSLEIQHLTSLKDLWIRDCPMLASIPEGMPSSLTYFEIQDCPVLEERCKREEGEDWPKISHITNFAVREG